MLRVATLPSTFCRVVMSVTHTCRHASTGIRTKGVLDTPHAFGHGCVTLAGAKLPLQGLAGCCCNRLLYLKGLQLWRAAVVWVSSKEAMSTMISWNCRQTIAAGTHQA